MKRNALFISTIFLSCICFLNAQQAKRNKTVTENEKNNISNKAEKTQSINDKVSFKDGSTTLFEINSEGAAGSLILPSVGNSLSGNKLYNNGGNLFWGDTKLNGTGGASILNDLSDAKYIGHSLFLGSGAGDNDDGTDNGNTGVGYIALQHNISGAANSAFGNYALTANTSGFGNTAIGYEALASNGNGNGNTAVGLLSLYHNNADSNSAFGYAALFSNTTGYENTAIGTRALYSNSIGSANIAIGEEALYTNTTGVYNTANGYQALYHNIGGSSNVAIGESALFYNTSGHDNTAVGLYALVFNKTGIYNTGVGVLAGPEVNVDNLQNTTAIGYKATPTSSDQVRIGNSLVASIGGYAPWSNLSDGRFKRNVKENVSGLNFILGLRPVTFTFDINAISNKLHENSFYNQNGIKKHIEESSEMIQSREKKSKKRRVGFIAQEVETLVNKLGIDFDGVEKPENEDDFYRLRYSEFVVPLVKGMQEQQKMIEELKNEIQELKDKLNNLAVQK